MGAIGHMPGGARRKNCCAVADRDEYSRNWAMLDASEEEL
jgi:hypothetical protein